MKKHKNRSAEKRRLFESVVKAWNRAQGQRWTKAAAAMAILGIGAHAEEEHTLPDVVVTGESRRMTSPKYTAPVRNIPQTVTIVPAEVIEAQGAANLRDVLRNVPGISIQAGEGGVPLGDNLSIRGFAARTDIFVDGVRDFGGYTRDPFSVEQVEVVKGPSSTNGGRGSTGGSVNMASKAPRLEPFRRFSVGVGSDHYNRYTADVNQPVGAVNGMAFRLNALYHSAGIAGRGPAEDQRWGVAPSLAFGLGTPNRATLSYIHLDQNNEPDYGIPWVPNTNNALAAYRNQVAPVGHENYYGITARDREEVKTDVATLTLEHDFNSQYTLRNLSRYGNTDRLSVVTAPRFLNDSTTTINRNFQDRDQVDSVFANQTDVTMRLGQDAVKHTVVAGVEFSQENSIRYRLAAPVTPTTSLFHPNPDDAFAGALGRDGRKQEAQADTRAFYTFDTVSLGDRWEIPLGVRYDQVKADFEDRAVNGVVTKSGRTDKMTSLRAGVVFKPTGFGSVFAGYGTSFNPASEGLLLSTITTNASNAGLAPEKNRTYELGTKWDILNGKFSLSSALFRTDKVNARTPDPDLGGVQVLEGKQRVQGIEIGAAGNLTDNWALFAAATFLDSEILETRTPAEAGNQLANTPNRSYSLWSTYKLPARVEVGAGVQHVGNRYSANNNLRTALGYTIGDAMVAWGITKDVGLRLNVNNVTDVEYIDRVGGGHVIPGEGRKVILTADAKF